MFDHQINGFRIDPIEWKPPRSDKASWSCIEMIAAELGIHQELLVSQFDLAIENQLDYVIFKNQTMLGQLIGGFSSCSKKATVDEILINSIPGETDCLLFSQYWSTKIESSWRPTEIWPIQHIPRLNSLCFVLPMQKITLLWVLTCVAKRYTQRWVSDPAVQRKVQELALM